MSDFTERARQVIVLAQETARELHHNYIGSEHLLAGLAKEEEGLAARVLTHAGITAELIVEQIKHDIGLGDETISGQIPFTPRAKTMMEHALREALTLGHNYIGTEHILLGLLRQEQGEAAKILNALALEDRGKLREAVVAALSGPGRASVPASGPTRASIPAPSSIVQTAQRRQELEKEYVVNLNVDGMASTWIANIEDIGVLVADRIKQGGRNVTIDVQDPQRLPRSRRQRGDGDAHASDQDD